MTSKYLLAFFAFVLFSTVSSEATVTFSGSYASNMKNAAGSANEPIGNRYIIVVDTGAAGFGAATTASIADQTSLTGGTLLGDTIVQSSLVASIGRAAADAAIDLSPYAGKSFGVLWFDNFAGTTLTSGTKYGFVTDASWIVPSVDGIYNFTTSPAGATDILLKNAPGAATLTVGVAAAPEPSRALLLGFGALGLMIRRRRA